MSSKWSEIQALVPQVLEGDSAGYSRFLSMISELLRPRLIRALPALHVEEAMQETLMAIHKSLHTLDPERPVQNWVQSIARYKIKDQLRLIYKRAPEVEGDDSLEQAAADELSHDERLTLEALLQQLNPREQQLVRSIKIEGHSVQDVAKEMNLSTSAVKVGTFRAMGKLRQWLIDEELRGGLRDEN